MVDSPPNQGLGGVEQSLADGGEGVVDAGRGGWVDGAAEEWTLRGDLTLNGRTRPVALDVEFNRTEEFPGANRVHAGFTATGAIRRSEFGIEFGMMKIGADKLALGDEVKIELDFEFVQPEEATEGRLSGWVASRCGFARGDAETKWH